MRCESARRAISVRLDEGEPLPPAAEAHRAGCPSCRRFEAAAWRVRELTRLRPAPAVPDLVPRIMAAVQREEADRLLGWAPRPRRLLAARPRPAGQAKLPARPPGGRVRRLTVPRAAVAGFAAGLLLGLVLTAGGVVPGRRSMPTARADEVPRRLLGAARALSGYRATYDVTELHWTREVPRRTFRAELAFRAPEALRIRVRDTTRYPSPQWPRNDLLLVTDGRTWRASGPDPCPAEALSACSQTTPVVRSVVGRAPFDPRSPLPTDVIVPMTVLAASDRVDVVGPDRVGTRDAVVVRMSYQDAIPLFSSLQFLGSWRPFFPGDRVLVWLDHETWFPLRYTVFPAPGPERAAWASQQGLPVEGPGNPVFEATVRSLSTAPPPPALFRVPPGPRPIDEGFRDATVQAGRLPPSLAARLRPYLPTDLRGLQAWRAGSFPPSPARPYRERVVAYSRGLSWLSVTVVEGWRGAGPFGVGPFAEPVRLPGGVGYYEPATDTDPRRVALHTRGAEVLLSSDLPRGDLLAMAGSVPARGLVPPRRWWVHRWRGGTVIDGLTPRQAARMAGFPLLVPTRLPPGYRPVAAEVVRTATGRGVEIVFRRPAAELDGVGLRLYEATGQGLPPPTGPVQQAVRVRGRPGRWSPDRHLLEWVEGGIYRSLSGPAFDLSSLIQVASSLRSGGEP